MPLTNTQLRYYDSQVLRLPADKRKEYHAQVDNLIAELNRSIRDKTEIKVSKVVKAGSFAKFTILRKTTDIVRRSRGRIVSGLLRSAEREAYGFNRIAVSTLVKIAQALETRPEDLVANLGVSRSTASNDTGTDAEIDRLLRAFIRLPSPKRRTLALEVIETLAEPARMSANGG